MLTEACVSIMLVGLVLTMVSLLLTRYSQATDYFLNYRRAQLAAESCIERMRAGLIDITDDTFTDEAGITYEVRVAETDLAWQPLQRISVTARVTGRYGRWAHYQISTYVVSERPRKGERP